MAAVIRQRINTLVSRELQHPEGNDLPITMELSDIIRRHGSEDVLSALKDPLKHQPPHIQLRALGALDALILNSGPSFAVSVSSPEWTERIYKIAKTTESSAVRDRVLLLVTQWCATYATGGFRALCQRFRESKTLGPPYVQILTTMEYRDRSRQRPSQQSLSGSQMRGVQSPVAAIPQPYGARSSLPPSSPDRARSSSIQHQLQPSSRSRAAALSALDTLMLQAQTDFATLEYSLEHPDMMDSQVAEDCRGHQRKIDTLLRTQPDLPEDIQAPLIVLLEELKEKLEIYDVIAGMNMEGEAPARGGGGGRRTVGQVVTPAGDDSDDDEKRARVQQRIDRQDSTASIHHREVAMMQAEANNVRMLEQERKESAALRAKIEENTKRMEEMHDKLREAKKKNAKAVEAVQALSEDLERSQQEVETWKARAQSSEEQMANPPPPPPPQIVTVYQEKKRIVDRAVVRRITTNVQTLHRSFRGLRDDAHELSKDVDVFVSQVQSAMGHIVAAAAQERASDVKALKWVQELYKKEQRLRKQYYNTIQDLKGNIRVYCRVRPMSNTELSNNHTDICSYPDDDELRIIEPEKDKIRNFEFDAVFSPGTTQDKVFEDTLPLIESVIDGYNVCIFAYGQTGSGKTFTMEGPPEARGINRRALNRLFNIISERSESETSTVHVSVLEIYNESIRDLLVSPAVSSRSQYDIHTNGPYGHYVSNLSEIEVHSSDEVAEILDKASSFRHQGKTDMNLHSSRSHMILYCLVKTTNKGTGVQSYGKLSLVDLAGSERLDKSGSEGQAAKEAACINKSLSALGDVIAGLSSSAKHIPFRNSTLTFLLQDSMAGQAKVLMFCCVSPASYNCSETLSSVQFAVRARGVSLGAAKKNVVR